MPAIAPDLETAKAEWSRRLLPIGFAASSAVHPAASNVVGVGVGRKISQQKPTEELALKFFVERKLPQSALSSAEILPRHVEGIDTDVEEVGVIRKHPVAPSPRSRLRPAHLGCSVGFVDESLRMAGTLGALVTDGARRYILSNNHVLANENRLPLGRQTLQPGMLDGGVPDDDAIGSLTRFEPLRDDVMNQMDAALSMIDDETHVHPSSLHIGQVTSRADAALDMNVHKFGRTTEYTRGRISSVSTDVKVVYDTGLFIFEGQIIIRGDGEQFSAPGDSGSLILTREDNEAVGLLFAGSAVVTVANHLSPIFDAFGVFLVS
jgi:Peptidase family S64